MVETAHTEAPPAERTSTPPPVQRKFCIGDSPPLHSHGPRRIKTFLDWTPAQGGRTLAIREVPGHHAVRPEEFGGEKFYLAHHHRAVRACRPSQTGQQDVPAERRTGPAISAGPASSAGPTVMRSGGPGAVSQSVLTTFFTTKRRSEATIMMGDALSQGSSKRSRSLPLLEHSESL
jgi:hypothetical protein